MNGRVAAYFNGVRDIPAMVGHESQQRIEVLHPGLLSRKPNRRKTRRENSHAFAEGQTRQSRAPSLDCPAFLD